MAEPIFIKLKHLGDTIIDYIDLFDEGVYGADKLYLRGRYTTFAEVKSAIEECLAKGSPIEDPATNVLSYNRFSNPDKKFFIADLNDPYAWKAQFILQFAIRIRFYDNFAYIHFGIPWARKWDVINDCPNLKYPFGKYTKGQTFTIDDLQVLRFSWISEADAETILKQIGLSTPLPLPVPEEGKLNKVLNTTTINLSNATVDLDAINQKLQKIKSLQDEIDQILAEVPSASLQELQDEQKGEYSTHNSTYTTYNQTLTKAQTNLQTNKDKFDNGRVAETDYESFKETVDGINDEISSVSSNLNELKTNVDALYDKSVELKSLCDERKSTKDKIDTLKQDVKNLEQSISDYKMEIQKIQTAIDSVGTKLSEHEGKGTPLKTDFTSFTSEKDAISTTASSVDSTKKEIDDTITKIEEDFTADAKLSSVNSQIKSASSKVSKTSSTIDKETVKITTLQAKINDLDSLVDDMITVIDSLETAQGDLGNADASLHENLETIDGFLESVTSLEEELITKEDADGSVQAALTKFKEDVESTKSAINTMDSTFANATKTGESIDSSLENFNSSTKEQIQEELVTFEESVSSLASWIENLESVTSRFTSELSVLESTISSLETVYPTNGGASADENTKVTSSIKKSSKDGIDYEIKTTVDSSEKVIEPRTLSAGQVLPDGSVTQSQKVAYVASGFWERPSDEVTKYEVQFAGQEEWGTSNVDSQGNKKGARLNMSLGENKNKSGEMTIKWEKDDGTVVSTVNITCDFVGIELATYDVKATSLTVEDTKLTILFDKKIPQLITFNVNVDEFNDPIQITSDGFLDKFELNSEADASKIYTISSVEGSFLNVTGTPLVYSPVGS